MANRGEIAVRIFRTCRDLGITTVAVAAPDDAGALHTRVAGETVPIASYLHSEEHIRAARQAGADAIHPGYGFLAENADFAEAVEAAGLTFVGPSPEALRAGGDKLAAKRAARAAGVPVLEAGEPAELGFPLLVKAAAGGGGRGMRVVRSAAELDDALDAARREAKAAFGDDTVFCERFLERPRHVEIQLLGDGRGGAIALGERECSVQRRHQKVLEESPSPALDPALRTAMSDAAVAFARAISLPQRGHGRVRARRPRLLLPRAERPDPGRASGDGAGHGPRPRRGAARARRGRRPSRPAHAARARRRGAALRRGPAHVPPPDGPDRPAAAPGGRPRGRRRRGGRRGRDRLRPDDRQARRPRRDAGRGPRPPRGRARRDRGPGRDDEPAVPALAGRAPGAARGRDDDRVPRRAPADVRAAAAPRAAPWRGGFRLNLPAPPAAFAARRERGRARARARRRAQLDHRADARHRPARARRRRATRSSSGSRSSCSRR